MNKKKINAAEHVDEYCHWKKNGKYFKVECLGWQVVDELIGRRCTFCGKKVIETINEGYLMKGIR